MDQSDHSARSTRDHPNDIWACDFVQTYDIWFRPTFAFLIDILGTREVEHVATTRSPTSAWTAQQLRNATPFGRGPRFIIRDRDDKLAPTSTVSPRPSAPAVIKTAVRTPNMNATCERFIGSVRRECFDQVLVLGECHLLAVLTEYVRYFNRARPRQGLGQSMPVGAAAPVGAGQVVSFPVLGGLHHDYRKAA